jgi:single-stranded DNA-specific DHH superfamily exonuclease
MPKSYDIFNGDADGICALHQLRLEQPVGAELITGVKRDIGLLDRVDAEAQDELTVLDISMKSNAGALRRALDRGARVRYFDHHASGEIPAHALLEAHIDTAPNVCTSLIVDRHIGGRHRMWAVVAAFGDNLVNAAVSAAQPLHLDHTELARLHELGECINYNAYGDSVEDLHYHPADLYRALSPYHDPRHFIFDEPVFNVLRSACAEDLYRASEVEPCSKDDAGAVYVLPDAAWSRRINGLFANRLAQQNPQRAHAILVENARGYAVSVRAPVNAPRGAAELCALFKTGGGREAAAGINKLPRAEFDRFLAAFRGAFVKA